MRVKFTRTVQYENVGRNQGPVYELGSEHDFTDDFAQRWIRRGAAVAITHATSLPQMAVTEKLDDETVSASADRRPILTPTSPKRGRPLGNKQK